MSPEYPERILREPDREVLIESDSAILVSHFANVLRRYRHLIFFSLLAVALGYTLIAVSIYLFSPAERSTTQTFRLDFEGAGEGRFPSGARFNIADIISGPILTRVWRDNHLGDYIPLGDFSRSVFVLVSNRQYDQLASEYQAKLADPKLSPIDRERIQNEFELKSRSITKNEYAIYFVRPAQTRSIPDPIARKVLLDTLSGWADFAVNQQHVITYQVSVLSPGIVAPSALEQKDLVAAIEVLRSKTNRALTNIQRIQELPGASLARTADHLSLAETALRLDEILRFRLEPLLTIVLHTPALIGDRVATVRFLESQLAYDQRQLEAAQRLADSTREAMAVYDQPNGREGSTGVRNATKSEPQKGGSESVTPQLSETFLDRLMTLTGRANDPQFRQKLVDEYRKSFLATIPLGQAVSYDSQLLDEIRKPSNESVRLEATAARAQVEQARAEIGSLIGKMNEVFQTVSRNMTPATQLFTLTGPPATRSLRSVSLQRLVLYGVLALLVALPIVIVGCLLHNRVREEEAGELRAERAEAP